MQNDDKNMIRNEIKLSKEDEFFLREKFITEYSKNKGWDKENLTSTQLFEITQQSGYKNPGLILS